MLCELVNKKWGKSVDRFFKDLRQAGFTGDIMDDTITGLRGAIIGWTGATQSKSNSAVKSFGICPDLNLVLAVLSRRIADMFIPSREPDFSWGTLFDSTFEVDDDSFPAPGLNENPWKSFQWDVEKGGIR